MKIFPKSRYDLLFLLLPTFSELFDSCYIFRLKLYGAIDIHLEPLGVLLRQPLWVSSLLGGKKLIKQESAS